GVKPATTTATSMSATASWQRSPTSPAVVASLRSGSRSNDLPRGSPGAIAESSLGLSLGLGVPVPLLAGYRSRVHLNAALLRREDPANPAVESRDRYLLAGLQGETFDRGSTAALTYGINTSELLGFEDARTDFHRVVGNARHR